MVSHARLEVIAPIEMMESKHIMIINDTDCLQSCNILFILEAAVHSNMNACERSFMFSLNNDENSYYLLSAHNFSFHSNYVLFTIPI